MAYAIHIKQKAIQLRKSGWSLKEISEKLKLAKSTASEWLIDIELSEQAQERLAKKQILGQYKSIFLKKVLKNQTKRKNEQIAHEMLSKIPYSKELMKLNCALIWWCEGNKDTSIVRFTNSDSTLIANFIFLLRNSFDIDESKFRVLVHIHAYHDDNTQKQYWSKITQVPLSQFHRSYQKPNTGIHTRENYQGCIALTYYDARIAKELEAIYNAFSLHRGIG